MGVKGLTINDQGYFEMPGLNVLVFHNTFAEGHQGDIEIIQHEDRVATNGNLRLSPSPGQWQPWPVIGEGIDQRGVSPLGVALHDRKVNLEANELSMTCHYPDPERHRKGFNPLIYPDLDLSYTVRVKAQGTEFTVTIDLDAPLPAEWVGRVGFNLELFPGNLYGKSYYMDGTPGVFPRQAAGPTYSNLDGEAEAAPLAEGRALTIAPESDEFRMTIESHTGMLALLDGSLKHSNGWFVVRSLVTAGAAKGAIVWTFKPYVMPDYLYKPVIHFSQVGYHPKQKKTAYIELDKRVSVDQDAVLLKVLPSGDCQEVMRERPALWGQYLRYQYALLDFSRITETGLYRVRYCDSITAPFPISPEVYKRHVWQPTLEYFLPMQMCHMKVMQKYRVWHGLCHMDDALMAPIHINHFDGYQNMNETSTLSSFAPLEHVPGLAIGGWHDAGDDDLRTETQTQVTQVCALAYEEFGIDYDVTLVDQEHHHVEIHQPDGKPDLLQQVEHGALALLAPFRQFGRMYRGMIVPTLRQYVHLGDPSAQTDNKVCWEAKDTKAAHTEELWYKKVANRASAIYDPSEKLDEIEVMVPELDDRLVFMDSHPVHQINAIPGLAAAARVLKGYNDALAEECLAAAEALWQATADTEDSSEYMWFLRPGAAKLQALVELYLTTRKDAYLQMLCGLGALVKDTFERSGWALARVLPWLPEEFKATVRDAAEAYKVKVDARTAESPFGCPLRHTEFLAFTAYYLHKGWPELFSEQTLFDIVHYLLGCRPGRTVNSLVSGVGGDSPTVAYGFNRADWSYIPGGTFWNALNLVNPDFPEDKVWPFLWQEREYIAGAPCEFMFAVIAMDKMLEE